MSIDPWISEWGNPAGVMSGYPMLNQIDIEEGTRGTETSKYPEEKKEKSISVVAASEEERGQTVSLRTHGVEERRHATIDEPKDLERSVREGDSPVGEVENS